MAGRPGRNDPCPCGSGKKYKRCCLPADESIALERERQPGFDGELDEDGYDDEFGDIDMDVPPLDVQALTRVRYARGFVKTTAELYDEGQLQVTEWDAQDLPQALLDAIAREEVDALEGDWGDPKAAAPVQVDSIDLELADDVINVTVYNRSACLGTRDAEELQRLERLCLALEEATAQGHSPAAGADDEAPARAVRVPMPSRDIDWSALLKEHRRQPGRCALCDELVTRRTARRHLARCVPAHDLAGGPEESLLQVRITSPSLPAYWLDVEMKARAGLTALDAFLRNIWLECCGHLSAFEAGRVTYYSTGYDFSFSRDMRAMGINRGIDKRTMNVSAGEAFSVAGGVVAYEYDFGSTTPLRCTVTGERVGRPGRALVRLLVRNTPPTWPCGVCEEAATLVCVSCWSGGSDAFVCDAHLRRQHHCGEADAFLPVANSPRMGVCAYTGE